MGVLLLIHIFITLSLIGVILLQRSEGGGLGLGGGGSAFTARGTANLLTRVTATLAVAFFANCLLMGIVSNMQIRNARSILEEAPKTKTVPSDQSVDSSKKVS